MSKSAGGIDIPVATNISYPTDNSVVGIVDDDLNNMTTDVLSNDKIDHDHRIGIKFSESVPATIIDNNHNDAQCSEIKQVQTNGSLPETWEDRIQREIDATKRSIEQILVDNSSSSHLHSSNGVSSVDAFTRTHSHRTLESVISDERQDMMHINKETDVQTLEMVSEANSLSHHRRFSSVLDDSPSIDIESEFATDIEGIDKSDAVVSNDLNIDALHIIPALEKTTIYSPTSSPIPTQLLPPVSPPTPEDFALTEAVKVKSSDNFRPISASSVEYNKWNRRSHLVVENDDYGEGLNVISIEKLSNSSSSVPHRFIKEHRRCEESFNNSLLDDDQCIGPERRRAFKDFVSEQLEPYDDDDTQHVNNLFDPASNKAQQKSFSIENLNELEEKKDYDDSMLHATNCVDPPIERHTRISLEAQLRRQNDDEIDPELRECLSATESEVASLDGLPSTLQNQLLELGKSPRDRILQTLDGVFSLPVSNPQRKRIDASKRDQPLVASVAANEDYNEPQHKSNGISKVRGNRVVIGGGKIPNKTSNEDDSVNDNSASCGGIFLDTCVNNLTGLWNGSVMEDDRLKCGSKGQWNATAMKQKLEVPLAILDCSNIINQEERIPPYAARVHSSFVRVARNSINVPYGESIYPVEADPRMQDWIANHYTNREKPPADGTYLLGQSRTVVIHEINRGHWTWCTAWSPNGMYLAVATDNHHLAVVDTSSSTVWRVKHDQKVKASSSSNITRSIRCIDWGSNFIAIGGTGNTVSILSQLEPYQILHDIPSTGFVGSVHWRGASNTLAIGSRLDFVLIVRINEVIDTRQGEDPIYSEILHKIEYKFWVNSVKFSADGSCIAVGDAGGIVSVYDFEETGEHIETHMITWFKRKESILSIEWSPDGKWLYAGGEDCTVIVVETTYWEIVHRIGQDRWVQCIASSCGGTHVAIGGVSSEISILDVDNGWDSVMGIELKGLVPLSAKWHPRDQYLVLTGQDNSVIAVETTNARHVKGHHLHSISPIRAIEFSPDGRMVVVGNETGIVTFFSLSGTSFTTVYELVIPLSRSVSIQWSLNGTFVAVGSANSVVVVARKRKKRQGPKCPPNASGFSVVKVIGDIGLVHAITIDYQSNFVAVSGDYTRILDVRNDFSTVQEFKNGPCYTNSWSPDGRWLAMMGKDKFLTIYDTSAATADRWSVIFSMKCDFVGRAIAWGPLIVGGLLYLAYGGESNEIYIMEIRTYEGTWETVLKIKRDACINALDWCTEGLLAAGVGNGTVCVIDLAYLQSGIAVNEMDYLWQRQALTCFTEIRRNRGVNSIKSLRWLPAAPGSDRLLAVGGTDGEVEIIDLTERKRCKGYSR